MRIIGKPRNGGEREDQKVHPDNSTTSRLGFPRKGIAFVKSLVLNGLHGCWIALKILDFLYS